MSILPSNVYNPLDTYVSEDVDPENTPQSNDRQRTNMYGVLPTKTWRLDREKGRIVEEIDGELALQQFVMKALRTARNRYLIYNEQYGTDVYDFIGQDSSRALAMSEVPRLIRETLVYDDRINSVDVIDVRMSTGNEMYVTIRIDSVYGTEEVRTIL